MSVCVDACGQLCIYVYLCTVRVCTCESGEPVPAVWQKQTGEAGALPLVPSMLQLEAAVPVSFQPWGATTAGTASGFHRRARGSLNIAYGGDRRSRRTPCRGCATSGRSKLSSAA